MKIFNSLQDVVNSDEFEKALSDRIKQFQEKFYRHGSRYNRTPYHDLYENCYFGIDLFRRELQRISEKKSTLPARLRNVIKYEAYNAIQKVLNDNQLETQNNEIQ